MFAWKGTQLPALLMGFTDTDVPVASTALRALGWSCPVSLARSALCLGQVSASLAPLAWPAAAQPLCSRSAAPEVSNACVQQKPKAQMGKGHGEYLHSSFWLSHSSGSL